MISISSTGNTRKNATGAKQTFFKTVYGMLGKNVIEIIILLQKRANSKEIKFKIL
jgi:hypothetical protein